MVTEKQRRIAAGAVLVLIAAAVYLPSVGYPAFDTDDFDLMRPIITADWSLHNLLAILTPGHQVDYFPLRDLVAKLDWTVFGPVSGLWRLSTIALYGACGWLLFECATMLAGLVPAFVCTLLWIVSPLHVEAVVWLSSRKDVLAGFFALLFVLVALRRDRRDSRVARLGLPAFAGLLAIVGTASLLSKPSAAICLIVPCLYLSRARERRIALAVVGAVVCCVGAVSLAFYTRVNLIESRLPRIELIALKLLGLGRGTLRFFGMERPALDIDYDPAIQTTGTTALYALVTAAVLLLFAMVVSRAFRKARPSRRIRQLTFYLFLATLVPVSGAVLAHPGVYADRYFFLPSVFAMLFAATFIKTHSFRAPGYYALAVIMLVSSVVAVHNWSTPLRQWQFSASVVPSLFNRLALLVAKGKGAATGIDSTELAAECRSISGGDEYERDRVCSNHSLFVALAADRGSGLRAAGLRRALELYPRNWRARDALVADLLRQDDLRGAGLAFEEYARQRPSELNLGFSDTELAFLHLAHRDAEFESRVRAYLHSFQIGYTSLFNLKGLCEKDPRREYCGFLDGHYSRVLRRGLILF